jgi:3-hydroxyacyl-[acyl-carrier-protein] dehydratase
VTLELPLDSLAIRKIIPHRYPFLLVDQILELDPGQRAVGIKNVTANEPYFQGHFPGMAVMPGVLIIEAMAQVAGIMMLSCAQYKGKIPFIAAIESARYYQPVVPGDALVIEATAVWVRSLVGKVDFVARVAGNIVVKGEMKFALKDAPPGPAEQLAKFGILAGGAPAVEQGE